jgi:hypothetical protein
MDNGIVTVIIAGLIFAFVVARMSFKFEERKLALKAQRGGDGRLEAILTATQQEVTRLRERVQVLEKLVTDDDRKLADDIERLRRDRSDDIRG